MADRDPLTRDILDRVSLAERPLFQLLLRCLGTNRVRQQELQTRKANIPRQWLEDTANHCVLSTVVPDCLQCFEINVPYLGTVGRVKRRRQLVKKDGEDNDNDKDTTLNSGSPDDKPYRGAYKELPATCYGIIEALLPWRHTLRTLTLENVYITEVHDIIGLNLCPGSQLLSSFDRVETLSISLASI